MYRTQTLWHDDAYSRFVRTPRCYTFKPNLTVAKFFAYFHPLQLKSALCPWGMKQMHFISLAPRKGSKLPRIRLQHLPNKMNHSVDDNSQEIFYILNFHQVYLGCVIPWTIIISLQSKQQQRYWLKRGVFSMLLLPLKVCLLNDHQNEVTDISICARRITCFYTTSIKHKYINTLKICRYVTQHELIQNYKWYNKDITVYNYMYTPYGFSVFNNIISVSHDILYMNVTLKKKYITKYSFAWCVFKHDCNWSTSCVIENVIA